ncbi:MAG: dihydroorotase [Ilumatobacteraceae bacterium]
MMIDNNTHNRTSGAVLITGGTVLDRRAEQRADVRIIDGFVTDVRAGLDPEDGETVLDATGCMVSPGFVDIHVHLRQPGREEAETVESGSRAAARGGFTAVVAMPNTEPPHDSLAVVEMVRRLGEQAGLCEVLPSGCITMGRAGEALAPFAELHAAGVQIFTDDGNGVQDPLLMRRALEYGKSLGITLAQHCEVSRLTEGAVMHEGGCCSRLGVPGWPSIAEELMVFRDIELCRLTGAPVHFLHLSTAKSVDLVRAAKADGLPVTAEAAPHHFTLTDEMLSGFDPIYKVNPPLRELTDVVAVKRGLADGTIDAIATDHAPHSPELKEMPLDQAPPGMLGLETSLALSITELEIPLQEIVALLSWRPAAIAGVADRHGRDIEPGVPANITVFDPTLQWTVSSAGLASKSRNTPYAGRSVRGKVRHTIFRGAPVVVDGVAQR